MLFRLKNSTGAFFPRMTRIDADALNLSALIRDIRGNKWSGIRSAALSG
jgi:hypothetical protein